MASLVLKMSVSMDGYVAAADGSTDWVGARCSADGLGWTVENVSNACTHLMGATTYAAWAGYWPGASGPLAEPMNEIPKVVFSDSLASAGWGETTIARGDLAEAIRRLKQERSGGYLLAHGGARFARSLVKTGLIDEYRLVIAPQAGHDGYLLSGASTGSISDLRYPCPRGRPATQLQRTQPGAPTPLPQDAGTNVKLAGAVAMAAINLLGNSRTAVHLPSAAQIIRAVTDGVCSVVGEGARDQTWVVVEGISAKHWGFGGEVRS